MLRGNCLCGGVRFEFPDELGFMAICHCTTCKKISGGGWTAAVLVPTDRIEILEGHELLTTYQPSEGNPKTFCSSCGANLFGGGWPKGERSAIRLSAIESPFDARPEAHIFVRSVAPWETLPDDGIPRFEERPT